MNKKPSLIDAVLLSVFVILITWQPYVLHHEIIMMDTGIHFPFINALFHGMVPFRDFVFYRGPFELYVPAGMMLIWGPQTALLPIFFYVGTILTLLVAVLIAYELYLSRLIFYMMVPVFVARTFPRIAYYYWGGLRYFIGLLVVYFAILGFKNRRPAWFLWAGAASALSFLTTVEAGFSTIGAVMVSLGAALFYLKEERAFLIKCIKAYIFGNAVILVPYTIFMLWTGSLIPFLEASYIIPTKIMTTLLDARGTCPGNFVEFLQALVPGSTFFKYMTPFYFYVFFFIYLVYRLRKRSADLQMASLITLAIYGIILYAAAFRKIDGHHFEMALQPQKVLYFFLIGEIYLYCRSLPVEKVSIFRQGLMAKVRPEKFVRFVNIVLIILFLSSIGYAFQRYSRRFTAFKWASHKIQKKDNEDLSLLKDVEKRALNIERGYGMIVPVWQAEEIEGVVGFLEENTKPDEAVFTYPELGNFNFWADRPFVGRFPIGSFSWIDERWHNELFQDLKRIQPKYAVMTNLGHRTFPAALYFRYPKNIRMFNEVTDWVLANYKVIKTFESVSIYEHK